MSDNKKPTAEQIAEELAAIAIEHLDTLSDEERERRIVALEKRVAKSCAGKRASDSTTSSSAYTRPIPAYARDRERN